MRKLYIPLIMALAMVFMAGPAFANVEYKFTVSTPPPGYTTDWNIDPPVPGPAGTVTVEVWATNIHSMANEVLTFDWKLLIDETKVSHATVIATITPNPALPVGSYYDNGGGDYDVSNYYSSCPSGVPDELLLVTFDMEAIAAGDHTLTAKNDNALYLSIIECTTGNASEGVAGVATIHNAPPPCTWQIVPSSATVDSFTPNNTQLFSTNAGGFCDNCSGTPVTPLYVYMDNCMNGDTDALVGLFTATQIFTPEDCEVTTVNVNNSGCDGWDFFGSVSVASMHINALILCDLEIYTGGYPVPPLNTYNRPGRRGLALTCGDSMCFEICHDCTTFEPTPIWTMIPDPGVPAGTTIDNATGCLTIGECDQLEYPVDIMIIVTDPANGGNTDNVTVTVGQVILSVEDTYTAPGSEGVKVTLSMCNRDHEVRGVQTDIVNGTVKKCSNDVDVSCEEAIDCMKNGCDMNTVSCVDNPEIFCYMDSMCPDPTCDDVDLMVCTGCQIDPDRTSLFTCSANEQPDGSCRVVLFSLTPGDVIKDDCGPIAYIDYDIHAKAPADGKIDICPTDSLISDRFGDPLCVCEECGEISFIICGDVYPRECLGQYCRSQCGDGVVDIFDILEEIDQVLGLYEMSECQLERADVPTGTPPYCTPPDGEINIFDVLVIIDMALGKSNCCEYFFLGSIY